MRLSTRLSYNFNVFYENKRKNATLVAFILKVMRTVSHKKGQPKLPFFTTLMAYLAVSHLLSLMAFWTTNSTDHCC